VVLVMDTTFAVLSDPNRRAVLRLLRDGERSVSEIGEELALSQPGLSKNLRVLRESGLVRVRKDAQRRLYAIRPEPMAEIDEWLEPYRDLWNGRLDALGRHLEKE
jgi:DNA-binding transcriptional ArsR family regulator